MVRLASARFRLMGEIMSVHSLKLVVLSALFVSIAALALLGQSPASAALAPAPTSTLANASISSRSAITATAVVTTSQAMTPTATTKPAATSTKTSVPPTATKTKTLVPIKPVTVVITPTSALITPTKPIPSATPTFTKSPTATLKVPTKTLTPTLALPTKTLTPTVTRTATVTPTAKLGVRAAAAGTLTNLSTAFVVQNLDQSSNSNISATFYDFSGNPVPPGVTCNSLLPNRSCTVDQRVSGGGLDGQSNWQGSVVLSSTMPAGAVVLQYGGTASSARDFRMDAYTGSSGSQAATSVLMPQLVKNIWSPTYQRYYYSTFAIQNTSSSLSANVVVTYTNPKPGLPPPNTSVKSGISIAPGASAVINMMNEVPEWSDFNGPARLTSDQPVTVVANTNAPGVLSAYAGYTSGDASTTLIVPQAVTNLGPMVWSSAITGMTVDGQSSTYQVTYSNNFGGAQKTCNLPDGPSFTIDMRPQYFPAGCAPPLSGNTFYGTVVVVGSRSLVGSVNTQAGNTANGVRGAVAFAFPASGGSTTGFAPYISNNYLDTGSNLVFGTAMAGRMDGTGTVRIEYFLTTGQVYTDTYTVGTDRMFTFDQRFANSQTGFALPAGSVGSAKLTAPFPMVFKVNINGDLTKYGDLVGSYRGINQ